MISSSRTVRSPTLGEALVPVVCLVVFLAGSVLNLNDLPEIAVLTPTLRALGSIPYFGSVLQASIPVQIPLVAATAVAALMAWRVGLRWDEIHDSFLNGIRLSLGAVLILLIVGVLIGTWIASGIVPMLIVLGLKLLSPGAFLVATCVICAIVSLVTGSSWTTAGTVGVALIGVGTGLNVPLPIVAGAIVSGAYFGDKMSPLSDTTNLAPAIAGSELFEHVRHMMLTSGPSLVVALVLYWLIGLRYGEGTVDAAAVNAIVGGLSTHFHSSGWLMIAPLLVVGLVVMRVPALPALLVGAILGGVSAGVFQGTSFAKILTIAYDGYVAETGVVAVDELLTRGGLASMYGTVGIILCAMCFGGVMERAGMLGRIAQAILGVAKSRGGLVTATIGTCVGMNVVASDQYLSIVVPGRMYRAAFARARLHPKNLSRCLEDGGTLSSALVPWNTCGAFMFATLGVFPLLYLPYAFLNLVNPLVSIIYGYTGWTMTPGAAETAEATSAEPRQPATVV
jgi:Na+:H+ antiporter, NhaC family